MRDSLTRQRHIGYRVVIALAFAALATVARGQSAQNVSAESLSPRTFQALAGAQGIFVLGVNGSLWLESAPFGSKVPPQRRQVDANVATFQALDASNVLVLGRDGNLWLEHAPFGKVPAKREQVDGNVWTFQAVDARNVFVLGSDGKLWLSQAPFGNHRTQVDANTKAFQVLDDGNVLVLGYDSNLWMEQGPFGNVPPQHRSQIDANVFAFQGVPRSTSIFVLGTDGNLWLESPPFGKPPPRRQQVDGSVKAFQALPVLNWVWVLGTSGDLWLEQGPFGRAPPARQQVDTGVVAFQGLDTQHALVLLGNAKLTLAQAPFGRTPGNLEVVDANVMPYARPGGPYLQSCRGPGPPDLTGTLFATFCPNYFGNLVPATLGMAHTCVGTIQNINGYLRCVVSQTAVTDSISETLSFSEWSDAKGKYRAWAIDEPNVVQATTAYRSIQFHPGDQVTVGAGGCVQTGGMGKTWKSYTNPLGQDADHLYSGTIYIPGVTPPGGNAYPRIGGFLNKSISIPEQLPPTIAQRDLFLHLGYQDEPNAYGDNGYYKHDDGNYDQCKGVGPAWVSVTITTPSSPPSPPVSSSALPTAPPGAKPFDEIWDPDHEDMNGLPWNPYWAYELQQIAQGVADPAAIVPDFQRLCGPAFPDGSTIDTGVLANDCTSQSPTADISHSPYRGVGGYCSGDPLSGHLEWYISTITGQLAWESFSGTFTLEDDDFNFTLAPNGLAGLAATNGGTLGLEFRAGESIDNFSSDFWTKVRNEGENGDPSGDVNSPYAIVTGLLGVDAVHGGKTELHPVYSMAIRVSSTKTKDGGLDETWQIFLVNAGVGGGCSTYVEHQWLGLSDGVSPGGWYFISIPGPNSTAASSFRSQHFYSSAPGTFVEQRVAGWDYIGFLLPQPPATLTGSYPQMAAPPSSVDGFVTIHYNTANDDRVPLKSRMAVSRPGERVDEGEWNGVMQRMDPATRQRLEQLRSQIPVVRIPSAPHTVELTLDSRPETARRVQELIARMHRRAPLRARAVDYPGLQGQIRAVEQSLTTIMAAGLRPVGVAQPAPPSQSFGGTWELVSSTMNNATQKITPMRITITQEGALVHIGNQEHRVTSSNTVTYQQYYVHDAQHGHQVQTADQADLADTFTWRVDGPALVFETIFDYRTANYYGHPAGKQVRTMAYRRVAP